MSTWRRSHQGAQEGELGAVSCWTSRKSNAKSTKKLYMVLIRSRSSVIWQNFGGFLDVVLRDLSITMPEPRFLFSGLIIEPIPRLCETFVP